MRILPFETTEGRAEEIAKFKVQFLQLFVRFDVKKLIYKQNIEKKENGNTHISAEQLGNIFK